jgi:hypothetical protein
MGQGRFERFAPLTGIVFFVLVVALFFVADETPNTDDSRLEIVSYWLENDAEQVVVSIIGLIASVFLLWFAASLRSTLWRAEGGSGRLATLSFGGAILAVAGMMILFGMNFAVAESADDVPPAVVHSLSTLNNGLFFPFIGGFAVFMLASGLAILRTGALPAVAGWLAFALGILCFAPIGFFAFLAGTIWAAVVSVMLYRRGEQAVVRAAAPPAQSSSAI